MVCSLGDVRSIAKNLPDQTPPESLRFKANSRPEMFPGPVKDGKFVANWHREAPLQAAFLPR
jgi:hypothetical protein